MDHLQAQIHLVSQVPLTGSCSDYRRLLLHQWDVTCVKYQLRLTKGKNRLLQ